MDRNIQKSILLLLDGGRLLSMGILQQQPRNINEILADTQIHTKVRELKDLGRISDEYFHLLFPPADLSQWDATITSRFLKHCTVLEEPHLKIMDELHELRNKGLEMYQHQEMSNEDCTSVWKRIVNILQRGTQLLTGPIEVELDETIKRIEHSPVTPEDMDRVQSWYDLETNYKDTDACYGDITERKYVVHDAAFHGKLSTLKYVRQKFPDRLQQQDTKCNQAVHIAAERGHIDCLRYICESFPELKELGNENGMDALHCAARGGFVDCLKYLIGEGMKTDTRSKHGSTILHEATYGGSVSMVRYIYETFPALTNEINEKGQDAIFTAVRGGNLDCLKYLINHGMNIDTRSKNGNTLLHEAAFRGSKPMVVYLYEKCPKLKKVINEKGHDTLHNAALGGRLDCVKYLVGQGMNTERECKPEYTLLHDAAYGGSVSVVKYIWEEFPNLRYEKNEKGMDALFSAAIGGSVDCLQYLIDAGMKTKTRSKHGSTILHEAAFWGSVTIVQYVCTNCPELKNEKNEIRQDALHSAACGGSLDCLKYLIGQGMTIYNQSKNGNTILHQAAYCGREGVVRYLCENYCELLSYKQTHGQTAIFSAVQGGHLEILNYLLSQKNDPKQTDKKGHTLLHAAAWNGKTSIVRYLCTNYKCLIPLKAFKGETARELAHRNKKFDCVQVLEERF